MKKAVKLLAILAVFAMLFCFAGCNNADNNSSNGSEAKSGIQAISKDKLKIGVIHIGDPADGSGYSYAHDMGIQGMQKNLGLKDDQIVRKLNISDGDSSAIKTAIEDCIAKGCNIIFGTSFGYGDTMDALAKEYPEVIFSHGTGSKSNDQNFNNYFGRIYQARFLAGIAAGLKTESNKIGYVSAYGTEMAETCSGINAFALGAQTVNPNAVVYVKTLNSWYDPQHETEYAEALVDMGCDVIAQHCDTPNPQIVAEKRGVFGCGYNSDMTKDAPKAHLTAPIWNWDVYYTSAVQAAIDGKWAEFGNYYGGIKEGFVDISPLSENCAEGTQKYIDEIKAAFKDGSFDVFSGYHFILDENGELEKVGGDIVTTEGEVVIKSNTDPISDDIIKQTMNYFVLGVELK